MKHKAYRAWIWAGWSVLVLVVGASMPLSWLAVNPHSVSIVGDEVRVYRTFPGDHLRLPRPMLSYVETVRPLTQDHNGGHPCEDRGGPFRYTRAEDVGRWRIPWAAPCLSDPVGFRWEAQWTWHLGALRMGAVGLAALVLKQEAQK